MIVVANLLLLVTQAMMTSSIKKGWARAVDPQIGVVVTPAVRVLDIGPLAIATIVAAWGPWPWRRRLVGYLMFLVGTVTLNQSTIFGSRSFDKALKTFLPGMVQEVPSLAAMIGTAALLMALVGSWMGIRLGPPKLRPERLTILSFMAGTAIIGMLISARNLTEKHAYLPNRPDILIESLVLGPIIGILFGCLAASAYRWSARLFILLLIAGYGYLQFYYSFNSVPQFPRTHISLLALESSGLMIGLLLTWAWVVGCIRLLDRSGWPCSRRTAG